jgi:PleD family two-component response regulator
MRLAGKTGMSKRRVLIVDDDVNLSRLSGMILENSGTYEVMIVNESVRALSAALQFRPDVMLLTFLSKPAEPALLLATVGRLAPPVLGA